MFEKKYCKKIKKNSSQAHFFTLAASLLLLATPVYAEEPDSRAGHGHMSLGYQFISVDGFESSVGELDIGTVDTHSLNFEVEYYLTDRWTISAGLPFVRKRYQGPFPHDPLLLDPPRPEIENVDQGSWNNSFQDFHLGVRYLAKTGRLQIEPYAFLGVPSNDYPFFGHAAVGQNLLKFDVGSRFFWHPGLSDAYYSLDLSYVFVEETLGVSINHWKMHAEVGYYFSDRLAGRIFGQLKDGDGLVFPDDFPLPRTTELWYQHDRLVKHNYGNVGLGVDYAMEDGYHVSMSLMTMVWAEQVHKMDAALAISVSKSF